MALVARSTPSFALPATQNTAPVHEFRCLYTHDVRKKAKKWHDGSAKFHTFNKRVMVYDDAKNYIGDLHYRADEEFGEGVELHLDRGVLVEVGERLGETQTDLTGIINKPHADNTVPVSSANTRTRPIQRANHLNAQGKPRSLTELLGASQGRLGRAMLPVASPFEQRQALLEVQPVEPPSKRRKTATGKENDTTANQRAELPYTTGKSTVSSHITASSIQPRPQKNLSPVDRNSVTHPDLNQSVIDISSDDDVQHRQRNVAKPPRTKKLATLSSAAHQLSATGSAIKNAARIPQARLEERATRQSSPSHSTASNQAMLPPQSNASTSSESRLKPGMSSLKMVSQKPRRRLVYKALLPSINVDKNMPSQDTVVEMQDDYNASHQHQYEDIDQTSPMISQTSLHNAPQTPPKRSSPVQTFQQTPLFVSQNDAQQSPTPTKSYAEDNSTFPTTQQMCDDATFLANAISDEAAQADEMETTDDPESPCFPMPPCKTKLTAQSPPPVILPVKQPLPLPNNATTNLQTHHTPPPKKSRQFTRSLSENDSPLPHDPRASHPVHTLPPIEESPRILHQHISPLNAPSLPPPKQLANPSPNKSPFQRSHSDTAAIVATTIAPPVEPSTTEEQGPWTALEAFLLFDKWPACKKKKRPVFEPLSTSEEGDLDSDHDNNISNGIDIGRGFRSAKPVMIRSARSFMRDGG